MFKNILAVSCLHICGLLGDVSINYPLMVRMLNCFFLPLLH